MLYTEAQSQALDARHAALDAQIDALPDSVVIAVAASEGAMPGPATTMPSAARDYLKAQHPDDTERALSEAKAVILAAAKRVHVEGLDYLETPHGLLINRFVYGVWLAKCDDVLLSNAESLVCVLTRDMPDYDRWACDQTDGPLPGALVVAKIEGVFYERGALAEVVATSGKDRLSVRFMYGEKHGATINQLVTAENFEARRQ